MSKIFIYSEFAKIFEHAQKSRGIVSIENVILTVVGDF